MIKSDKIKYNITSVDALPSSTSEIKSSSIKVITPPVRDPDSYTVDESDIKQNTSIFSTKYTRDYYRGKSFHYAGTWQVGVHYVDDLYSTDFVDIDNALLVCIQGNFSSLSNKPILNYNARGDVESVTSDYWHLVLTGIHGKSPGIRYNEDKETFEICEDTSLPVEQQVWTEVDFGSGWVPKTGGTFTGPVQFDSLATFINGAKFENDVDLSGFVISNVGDPVNDWDAISKSFLQSTIDSYPASAITNNDIDRWDASSIWVNENKE